MAGEYTGLLAKSPGKDGEISFGQTLAGHTSMVMQSFEELFGKPGSPSRLAEKWLDLFGLQSRSFESFYLHGMTSAAFHDSGKANSFFQEMLVGKTRRQLIYHDHLSGIFTCLPEVSDWLDSIPGLNRDLVTCLVIGHHLRGNRENMAQPLEPDRARFQVFKAGILDAANRVGGLLGLKNKPCLQVNPVWSVYDEPFCGLRAQLISRMDKLRRRLKRNKELNRFVMAARAALMVADSAGSGLAREGKDITDWIGAVITNARPLGPEDIQSEILAPRIRQIQKPDRPFKWNDFQDASHDLPARSLLLASCGSGKTLAAWRWIEGRLAEKKVSRVIFLYPTRATATEGFRDYVSWAPEAEAALMHGTSAYELEGMFVNPEDGRGEKNFSTEERLFALGYWPKRIFSATVDQLLGVAQNIYKSICLLPLLADSVLVFDEVHSFDHNLFSAFKRFLREFDVPVLAMTASLTQRRCQDLMDCGLKLFPEDSEKFQDLQAISNMERYQVMEISGRDEAVSLAKESLEQGKRVLWVVNTVDRCQQLAQQLNAFCYHSRFKLEDRKNRHTEVVRAFQKVAGAVIAITTQVCEMSLDLDAQVLITEQAPIPSLIQRMGRCNRRARPGDENSLGMVYVYEPETEAPYDKEQLAGLEGFLIELRNKRVSQAMLQDLLEKYGSAAVEVDRYCSFFDCGPWAQAREEGLRDITEFSVQAVLDQDIEEWLEKKKRKKPVDGLMLPAPEKLAQPDPRLGPWIQSAPAANYSNYYGLFKKTPEK